MHIQLGNSEEAPKCLAFHLTPNPFVYKYLENETITNIPIRFLLA